MNIDSRYIPYNFTYIKKFIMSLQSDFVISHSRIGQCRIWCSRNTNKYEKYCIYFPATWLNTKHYKTKGELDIFIRKDMVHRIKKIYKDGRFV